MVARSKTLQEEINTINYQLKKVNNSYNESQIIIKQLKEKIEKLNDNI
jgi:predicted  nucleic acid-binding Zn-ribbon protein